MNIRTSKPESGNKFYITTARGGYSTCIQGKPVDADCNVLSNCVGYACGRFNEIIGSMRYPSLNCNAESFIERAQTLGLTISNTPSEGAIMVWRKGAVGNGSDGAGHVAIVERVNSPTSVYTSESNYGGAAFFNQTRPVGDGNWGLSGAYAFRGFIVNPGSGYVPIPSGYVGSPVGRDTSKDQVEIAIDILHARSGPYLMDNVKGYIKPGIYNVLEIKDMTGEASNGYLWYLVHDGYWCAQVEGVTYRPKAVTPQPDALQLAVNQAVALLTPFVK